MLSETENKIQGFRMPNWEMVNYLIIELLIILVLVLYYSNI